MVESAPNVLDILCSGIMLLLGIFLFHRFVPSRQTGLLASALMVSIFLFGVLRLQPSSPLYDPGDESLLLWGQEISSALRGEVPLADLRQIWPGKGVWPLIIGLTGLVVVDPVLLPLAINSVVIGCIFLLLWKSAEIVGVRSQWMFFGLFVLNPGLWVWGPLLMRENIFWVGFSMLILGMVSRGTTHFRVWSAWGAAGATVLIGVRGDFGSVVVGVALAWIAVEHAIYLGSRTPPVGRIRSAQIILLATGGAWLASLFSTGSRTAPDEESESNLADFLHSSRRVLRKDDVISGIDTEIPLEMLRHAFFGPFPSELSGGLVFVVSGIGTQYFLIVSILALVGASALGPGRRIVVSQTILLSCTLLAVTAFSLSNYGIQFRFKTAFVFGMVPLAVLGLEHASHTVRQFFRGRAGHANAFQRWLPGRSVNFRKQC